LKAYQSVVEINPRVPEGYANQGRVLAAIGRHDDAIKSLMYAVGLAPANGQLFYEIGVAFKNAKREGAAKRFFTTAIRLLPSHAQAHYQVAIIPWNFLIQTCDMIYEQLGELRAGTVFSEDRCLHAHASCDIFPSR
jgi:tetratricopeptide (TPR) repeat protein